MKVLVTGAAGFIGFHLSKTLASRGDQVVAVDNINDYYTPALKIERLRSIGISDPGVGESNIFKNLRFIKLDITDTAAIQSLFDQQKFDTVVNLAAQAGVRYSITHPQSYIESNIIGFFNILEACRNSRCRLVYASSSSVYGENTKFPFSEHDMTDSPKSLYAATKKSNELMAHTYTSLYGIKTTGLRYFTVYGPWGRPDMAPILFANAITQHKPIRLFNNGDMERDFTYIDDIVRGTVLAIDNPPADSAPSRVFNIGCGHPVRLMHFISSLEQALGVKAEFELLPMQAGDVRRTWADTAEISAALGYQATTNVEEGTQKFAEWYSQYRHILL